MQTIAPGFMRGGAIRLHSNLATPTNIKKEPAVGEKAFFVIKRAKVALACEENKIDITHTHIP
jgi:hypothetical protein